jgi:hypothetical protein
MYANESGPCINIAAGNLTNTYATPIAQTVPNTIAVAFYINIT